jgi:CMP-N,N'-diacetyllegionaminic acid synthase
VDDGKAKLIVAIIPARIGSKEISQKNIKYVAGKPLVQWTLDAVADSRSIDISVLTSDDPRVLSLAGTKHTAHKRSAGTSSDTASLEDVVEEVIASDKLFGQAEVYLLLQPTSPVRTGEQIDAAIFQLRHDDADSLVSVVRTHSFLWSKTHSGVVPKSYDYKTRPRRQELVPDYEENGSIYVFTKDHWNKTHNRLGGKISLFEMPEESGMQIDSYLDMYLVEKILERREQKIDKWKHIGEVLARGIA